MPDVFHHVVDVGGVPQNVHTLGIGVVVHCEWTLKGFGKLPAGKAQFGVFC